MKKIFLSLLVLAAFTAGLSVRAQDQKAAAPKAAAPKAAAPEAAVKAQEPARKAKVPVKKQEEEEEAGVLIDSKADGEEPGRAAAQADGAEGERIDLPGGLPSSYGQCKGVVVDGARNLLVFESADDGTVYFVQVVFGRTGATWKLAGSLPRSAD